MSFENSQTDNFTMEALDPIELSRMRCLSQLNTNRETSFEGIYILNYKI